MWIIIFWLLEVYIKKNFLHFKIDKHRKIPPPPPPKKKKKKKKQPLYGLF